MTIHLPEKLETYVREAVDRGHFATLDEAIAQAVGLLAQHLEQGQAIAARPLADERNAAEHKPIWEKFQEIAAGIPEEDWDRIPTDSSEQLDSAITTGFWVPRVVLNPCPTVPIAPARVEYNPWHPN